MYLIDKANRFLERFIYKKHVKLDLYCLLYNLGLCLSLFIFDNYILYKVLSVVILAYNIYLLLFETLRYSTVNDSTYAKFKIIYTINVILFIIFPYNSLLIVGFFIIPYAIYFMNLADYYLGIDNLHWPYILHLLYGGIIFCIVFVIKEYANLIVDYPILNPKTLIFLQPFTLALAVNEVATELIDLRFIFRAKAYKDYIASCYDTLTDLPGRGGLFKIFGTNHIKALAMVDIDYFKKVNDSFGHDTGDLVLKQIADRLNDIVKSNSNLFACRWGGEEFVIASTDTDSLKWACIDLVDQMRNQPLDAGDDIYIIKTLSCGIATRLENESIDDLINKADEQCYLSKEKGRNQIHYNGEELVC